jgi:hypothetical protein
MNILNKNPNIPQQSPQNPSQPKNPTGNTPGNQPPPTSGIEIKDIKNMLTYDSSNEIIKNNCMRYYIPIKVIVIAVLLGLAITTKNDFFTNVSLIVNVDLKNPTNTNDQPKNQSPTK